MTQIELMRVLELFVFHNMSSSMSSANRSDPTLLNAKNENEFREAVYILHEKGKLKETEQQKNARLRVYPYTDEITGYKFPDHPTRKLAKSYDEVITAIRLFHQLAYEAKNEQKITQAFDNAFTIYAKHFDCYDTKLPTEISKIIKDKKSGIVTNEFHAYRKKLYLQAVDAFIKEHYPKRTQLWNNEYFTFTKAQILKFEKFLETDFGDDHSKNLLNEHLQNHNTRLESLISYINDEIAEKILKDIISNFETIKGLTTSSINKTDMLLGKEGLLTPEEKKEQRKIKRKSSIDVKAKLKNDIENFKADAFYDPIYSLVAFQDPHNLQKFRKKLQDDKDDVNSKINDYKKKLSTLSELDDIEKYSRAYLNIDTEIVLKEHPQVKRKIESLLFSDSIYLKKLVEYKNFKKNFIWFTFSPAEHFIDQNLLFRVLLR